MARAVLRQIVTRTTRSLTRCLTNGPRPAQVLGSVVLESIDDRRIITTPHSRFTLRVSNGLERWRAETLLTKEPETITWMQETIGPQSVFFDVGANVGIYSIYAACLHRGGTKVVSFEPEALNFSRLASNILDNDLTDSVMAMPLGLAEREARGRLVLSRVMAGAALHRTVAGAEAAKLHQSCLLMPLDSLVFGPYALPMPTHLKIDVDGAEVDVLKGAVRVLDDPLLRHVLVETEQASDHAVRSLLVARGFREAAAGKEAAGMRNVIFVRQP